MKHINIEQFSNGELTQQINREMEAVARNIADPNTEAKTARKITVTITLKPNEQRDFITTSITTKSTLAPTLGTVTALAVGKQANFAENDDLMTIMQVAGNIQAGTTASYSDDGISQKTTIKTGVQRVDVQVPNPVKLIPYRTFAEIEQPSSLYVFRVKDDGNGAPAFKLVEADNGLWKHAAMLKIKDYFEHELSDEYKENLTIIA